MATWLQCPECGRGKGEDHKSGCLRRHAPPIMDYTRPRKVEGKSYRDYGIKREPLKPVTGGEAYPEMPDFLKRATSVVKP
jgi:hypothetical protein